MEGRVPEGARPSFVRCTGRVVRLLRRWPGLCRARR